jgi:hypothetical protein
VANKIKLGLSRLSVPELIGLSQQITNAMTGNPNFTTPNPALATITTATGDLQAAYNAANTARIESKNKTIEQNERGDALRALLTQLASYVDNISAGKQSVITSAGMDVQSSPTSEAELSPPTGFTTTTGDGDGEIDLSWNSVANAQSYVVERSLVAPPAAAWEHQVTTTKSKITADNLSSGTRYWFRVAAVGSKGQSGWSDLYTRIAP